MAPAPRSAAAIQPVDPAVYPATAQQAATQRPDERQEHQIDGEIDGRNGVENGAAYPPPHQSQRGSKMAHAARPFSGGSSVVRGG